jgi:hypothetical protein
MEISVKRYHETKEYTIGRVFIDGQFECYSLEDQKQDVKVMHETRIPEGRYEIKLRTFGGHHIKYKEKFPDFHKGMLWLQNVPQFKDILIHLGNGDDDSSGCVLLGSQVDLKAGRILYSKLAYTKFYKKVVGELTSGKKLFITIQ